MVESGDVMYAEQISEYSAKLREKAQAFFASAGQAPLEVYRIEQFEPIAQDPAHYGKFYDGDSYVVIKQNPSDYDIHYWHGQNATSDEMGSAAALSVQLSGNLKLGSRHHLEEMGHETDLFASYFKQGIFYLEGGVESGFKHVEPETYTTKLLLIKGKRYPRVYSMPVAASSLNEGDCFVLDNGMTIYFWDGQQANSQEKLKACEIAQAIKNNERKNKATLFYPRDVGGEVEADFWALLGGKPAKINPALPDDQGPSASEDELTRYALYHVSDASGSMQLTEVTERPLRRTHLNDSDTYILELYDQVYVWQGHGSSLAEKQNGMKVAKDFVNSKGKPKGTRITRIPQGIEDAQFKGFFEGFYPPITEDFGNDKSTSAKQDIAKISSQKVRAADLLMEKLGSSFTKTVYYLQDHRIPVQVTDPAEDGKFFAESVYIIDIQGSKHRYLICWMGARLVGDQIAGTAEAINDICGGVLTNDMTTIRVSKGHETEELLRFFPNGFIILDEARVPLTNFNDKVNQNGAMFRVQAPYGNGARSIEQNERACGHLNSGDAFVVFLPGMSAAYLWLGKGANEPEAKAGRHLMQAFATQPGACIEVKEGEEGDDFWQSVGGQGDYSRIKEQAMASGFEPRLFHVSNATGYTFMKEVVAFTQEDLINDDVYILDAYDTLYVWIGNKSNKFEVKGAHTKAQQYLEGLTDQRNKAAVCINDVEAGKEPPAFVVNFIQWEPEVAQAWLDADPLAKLKAQSQATAEEAKSTAAKKQGFEGFLDPKTNKFPYDSLKGQFPQGVKGQAKEYYLSDDEFKKVMGMSVEDYDKLKDWKKQEIKKKVGLF